MTESRTIPPFVTHLLPSPEVLARQMAIFTPDGKTVRGAATIVKRANKEYIVTAHHVVGANDISEAMIVASRQGQPRRLAVRYVGHDQQKDITVVAPTFASVKRRWTVESGDAGVAHGQDVVCLGYAHGLLFSEEVFNINGFPPPLCTRGIVAFRDQANDFFLIDRHTAGGMSGGMVAYRHVETLEWRILGIIVGATYEERDIEGKRVCWPSGFTKVVGMRTIHGIIDSNPVGCPIEQLPIPAPDSEVQAEDAN